MTFTPAGITDDSEIRTASSIVDYIFRRLALTYLPFDDLLELGLRSIDDMPTNQTSLLDGDSQPKEEVSGPVQQIEAPIVSSNTNPLGSYQSNETRPKGNDDTAPLCYNCGNQTQRAGSCYVCTSCGSTTGCS